ncbi:hypothetical protein [uncultured Kordia sp.]|uniref:hypothetical protein n=1 Tax=uncultured Kordia sp. TaxID=507699 RepID=UPI00263576D7|nr:hypothetical protein [uncultured Kordia sp.]
MKQKSLIILLFACICQTAFAQTTSIPDPIFENFLESNGMGNGIANDQLVTTANIVNRTNLNVEDLNISDLTGIEDFTSLSELLASGNALQSLDLSNLTNLNFVTLHDNQLASLDISNNPNLGSLTAWNNGLTTINITGCVGLAELYLEDNLLTDLDLSLFPNLNAINVTNNQLTTLNIKNGTNNSSLNYSSAISATGNPNLECITVDDPVFSASIWMNIDTTTSFSTDCNATTYVHNDIFEDYLETHDADGNIVSVGDATSMGNGIANDDYVKTPRIEGVTTLDVNSLNINDLTGIEDFAALQTLSCYLNQLTTLNLASNVNLLELQASNNSLAQLNLSNNTALQTINIDNNTIDELDLSNNTALISVTVSSNDLILLDMNNGNNGAITSLLATGNPNLSCINVDNAAVANTYPGWSKDATTNYEEDCNKTYVPDANFENYLETHDAAGNTVAVGDATSMGNGIANDGIVHTTRIENVTSLSMVFKGIIDLTGIEDFTALQTLNCPFNNIVTLDLSSNLALTSVNAVTNNIQIVDVSNNTNLTNLTVSSNSIQSLDLSSNTGLTYIAVSNNQLTFLNIQNGNNGNVTNFIATQNPDLTCINVDDENAFYLTDFHWNKDSTATYGIHCDETYIPDANFENYLETNNLGNGVANDNYVFTSNISGMQTLNIGNLNIADLTGIEAFVALQSLSCYRNDLTTLDLSANTALINLLCYNNQLTTLDLSNNTALELLDANTNTISSLSLEANIALKEINLDGNDLTSLNLTTCVVLEKLSANNNNLEELNIANGNNPAITQFVATNNPNLTCIQVDDETASYLLNTSIWNKDDIASYSIRCDETYIPDANFENYLETHDANGNIVPLNDPTSMGNGIANDNYVTTANINTVTSLDINSQNISDATGIENFTALETFVCYSNNLSTLDVSANTALKNLICQTNNLTALDVSANTALEALVCHTNNLTALDLTTNVNLIVLTANDNLITSIDAETCVTLEECIVSNNNLDTLNVANGNNDHMAFNATGNPNLSCINVDNDAADYLMYWLKDTTASFSAHCYETYIPDANFENYLETHDANGNTVSIGDATSMGNGIANDQYVTTVNINTVSNLDILNLNIADLTGIEGFVELIELKANGNLFTTIDVSSLSQLTTMFLHNGSLTALDVTANLLLEDLRVENNQLTEIDLTNNTALRILQINGNSLASIDVTNNIELARIRTYANPITELDLSNNPLLTQVWVNNSSQLTTLDIKNGNNGIIASFNARNNPNLTCINVDNSAASYLSSWGINLDGSTSFGEHCYDTYIPDNNFENYLETHDADGNTVTLGDPSSMGNGIAFDDHVTTAKINTVTSLNVAGKSISNLTGIAEFTALEELYCSSNNINSLDLSINTALRRLECNINILSALDLSTNTNLEHVNTDNNPISALNLSTNVALTFLTCQNNQLTSLDLSNNPLLTSIFAANNTISTVTFGANTVLETLSLNDNSLTTIDVSQLTGLESLFLANNSITSINLISNPNLLTVSVESNALTELDVRNGVNGQITAFTAQNNPNLTCINVDDISEPRLNDWTIDTGIASFAEHCNETYVPDINFEIYLETHDADGNIVPVNDPTSMGNGVQNDNYVKTSRIENVTSLDISFFNIVDVTGIEAFTALQSFNCYDNSITTVNLSANTALTNLNCSHNQLTALDISANVNLEVLQASQNSIGTIDLQNNTALKEIYLQGASLTTLNLDPCVALEIVDVTFNSLTELSIQNGNNGNITDFNANANPPLSCISVDDETASYLSLLPWRKDAAVVFSENCGETYIPDANFENYLETHDANGNIVSLGDPMSMGNGIANDQYVLTSRISEVNTLNISQQNIADVTGIERFTQLESFMCYNNNIITLDVSANTALETLICFRNNITTLDVSGNTALITLVCYFNELTTLDVSTNVNLEIIEAGNNQLTTVDVSSNTVIKQIALYSNDLISLNVDACVVLEYLNLKDNDLTELRVVNGNNGAITGFDTTLNPNLICISVDDVTDPALNDWLINVDGSTSFGEHCNETQVPDAIFENYLETHDADGDTVTIGDPTSMGNGIANDGYVRTASIQSVMNLRVSNLDIVDLTGIEDFTALVDLNCSRNLLTSIDVSQNVLLTDLICSRNQLTSLDVSQNILLTDLFIADNQITSIDLSQNTLLDFVSASENQLTSLDLSNNPLMEELECTENLLTSLNINQCTVLRDLICNDNNLQTIDLTTNTGLVYFEANNNDLTSLDISQNTNLDYFSVENNLLTSIDVSQNTNLQAFSVEDNQITSLDLSLNVNLEEVICRSNALTSLNLKNGNNGNIDLVLINNNPNLTCVLVDDASYSFPFQIKDFQTMYNEVTCGIQVSPKVLLQGAALNPMTGEETLMRDDLRTASLLPTTSPYGDNRTCNSTVFDVTGTDAIVDWVWIELRDATNNMLVLEAKSALLQRDGDVVSVDGVSAVDFNDASAGNYYVTLKHRNHLGIMTSTTIALAQTETTVDFTDANDQITYGSNAQTTFGMQTDMIAMWTGNANEDTIVQYSGTNPDTPTILSSVLNDAGNFLNFPTYIVGGYNANDVNMDGDTQYSGTNPDTPFILQNVLAHPGNFLNFSTYQIIEQLPENLNN